MTCTMDIRRLTILFLSLFAIYLLNALTPLFSLISKFSQPLQSKIYNAGLKASGQQNITADILNELDITKKERNNLLFELSTLKIYQAENESLREMLKFFQKTPQDFIMANIIGRGDPFSPEKNYLVIDKGSDDELDVGMVAINEVGAVVGKITEIGKSSARLCLSTSRSCRFAAGLPGQTTSVGVTTGNFELTIKLSLIPQNINIHFGDIITTSGLEDKIPAGLSLGRVAQVFQEQNDIWQSAILDPLFEVEKLKFVSIIK